MSDDDFDIVPTLKALDLHVPHEDDYPLDDTMSESDLTELSETEDDRDDSQSTPGANASPASDREEGEVSDDGGRTKGKNAKVHLSYFASK